MGRGRRKQLPEGSFPAQIDSLAHDGRGVAHVEGKAVFIDGALPGETVEFVYTGRRRSFDEGRVEKVVEASPDRVTPRCPHTERCGGCSLQHMDPDAQIAAKQAVLLENLKRIGGVAPDEVLPPLTGPRWGYRRKARLGVRLVKKKGRVLVGFREKHSAFVVEMDGCEVLHPWVGRRLLELSSLIGGLSIAAKVPQIEVAIGDEVGALVFRVLEPPGEADLDALRTFGERTGLHIYLQPKGPDSVYLLWPEASVLSYRLPAYGLELRFLPTDFTQVNTDINRAMIDRALEFLDLSSSHRVLDLFCGLGNFTLPIATRAAQVVGVEGEAGLVQRARDNAARNGITNAEFHVANLMEDVAGASWLGGGYDRILLDPPRSGALEMIPHVAGLGAERILYVSCHPASLARDAGLLVKEHGYRLVAAGVMDMFPHTAHVESIALFKR